MLRHRNLVVVLLHRLRHTHLDLPDLSRPQVVASSQEDTIRLLRLPGVTVTTSVEAPGTIERSMGKMRRIVDRRQG